MTARTWQTPDDLIRAGIPADQVTCEICGRPYDGQAPGGARPLCAPHRAENSRLMHAVLDLILADAASDTDRVAS